jgi:putative DNA primase/helicase
MGLTAALSAEHFSEITHDSAVAEEIALARGYRTLTGTGADRDELESLGYKPVIHARDDTYPALLIPMHGMDGTVRGHQIKPAIPRSRVKEDGTRVPIKYETPAGAANVLDVPAYTAQRLRSEPGASLWITEGVKKTDCLVSQGMAAVGLTGVFNWKSKHGVLGDWEEVPLKGRPVVVCFDSDANGNRNVQLAMSRLGAWLKSRGASTVHYLIVPATVGDTPVKGVDDFFAAGGTMEVLSAAATQTPPGTGEKNADFTDAFLVEQLADALEGRFCWASGLGWLKWNGKVWKEVSDVEPLEAVRVWASGQFDAVLEEQRRDRTAKLEPKVAGWRAILGNARLTALRNLARGTEQVQRDAADFDGDPDLLTVGNGTVHLPTGRLLPFDPLHCITKVCNAEYRPGASHPSWTAALRAVPGDMHEWFQDRLGQALTGYMTPDHMMVIAHGTGSNGKSTVMEIVRKTLADYGVLVSDRVLMASPDAHPTELMDFRGARYALMEETPEARHLNVQRLKQTVGTPTIKARKMRMDTVEFIATHSLFINTNYRPTVTETDHGTWRRLALMPWPFTFHKPGTALTGPQDRVGDPALAYAAGRDEVRAAALAWMVEGARAWYARDRMMLPVPARVERETRDWRAETDLILGFADECLKFVPDAFTQTQDMLKTFNDWSAERGHRPWNDRTFASRFGSHDMVRAAKVQQGRFSVGGKQQRGWMGVEVNRDNQDPFGGEIGPSAPEPDDWSTIIPSECMPPAPDEPPHDSSCLYDPDGPAGPDRPAPEVVRSESEEPNRTTSPVALGFDLETSSAKQLFTGGHEGSFVRLCGVITEDGEAVIPNERTTLATLNSTDVIYGHNILGFDLLALAHHHGADYDALADRARDTQALEYLVDPPMSKGMPKGYYSLDGLAERYGVAGKTHDLAALARKHGGYDRIPLDDQDYNDYLRGDLAASKAVEEAQRAKIKALGLVQYADREMKVVALQNRATLNGWAVDTELLKERVRHEDDQRAAAVKTLHEEYGVPLNYPDRYKLKKKEEWPQDYQDILSVTLAREGLKDDPERSVEAGLAVKIPGEPRTSPWASDEGKAAIVAAGKAAGATHWPHSPGGTPLTSSDALGEEEWYDPKRKDTVPGLLQVYGHIPAVRALVDTVAMATGARVKYAEFAKHLTSQGRVHPSVGHAQGSGRWAYVEPSTSTTGKRGAAKAERDVLVADPGHMMLTSDHSQLDVRTVAALSQDPELIKMLQPGSDYHADMAEIYCGDRGQRDGYKPVSHGLNYGQGYLAIAKRNGLDPDMVRQAVENRGKKFWVQMEWTEKVRAQAAAGQLLDNGFGRPMRPTPERSFTQAPALMGQGASRDVMCESLLRLDRISERRMRPFLRGVIHDEIVLSVPEGEVAEWQEMLREAMTWEWRGVPILCDVSEPAFRWSECA